MEKKKILMKSSVAASNLLRTLHSLYQFGHFCDVTIYTDQLGIQKEFYVHKAVLAASSNYFKSLFLNNEMMNVKNCRVILQDIHAEEFVSFLKFVYTAELEIEVDRLHQIKEVAERLECQDLLEIFEEMKAAGGDLEPSVHLKKNEGVRSPWNQTEQAGGKERCDLSHVLAVAPMKKHLGERITCSKLTTSSDDIKNKPIDPNEDGIVSGKSEDESAVTSERTNETDRPLNEEDLKEAPTALSRVLPDQKKGESLLILRNTRPRKSTRNVPKVLPKSYACNRCNHSFHFAEQGQPHVDLEQGRNRVIKYSCDGCGQLFPRCPGRRQHRLAAHSRERGFPCLLCDKKFRHQKDISAHTRREHEKERPPQRCPYCDKVISSKCGLTVHIRTHTGEKPYKCECCPASFAQRSAFNTHVRKIHKSRKDGKHMPAYWATVPPAGKVDVIDSGIKRSNKMHHKAPNGDRQRGIPGKAAQEPEGGSSRSLPGEAQPGSKGQKLEPGDETNTEKGKASGQGTVDVEGNGGGGGGGEAGMYSNGGNGAFSSGDNPNEDLNDHSTEDPRQDANCNASKSEVAPKSAYIITCTKCTEKFPSRRKYANHCKEVHRSSPGKGYQCDVCSKSFASYSGWKEHRTCVHTEDRKFSCTLCNATFKRKRDVRTHCVRKHEGRGRRPLCSVCGKILSSRTALVFHMRTHTGEKPYQCGVCGSRFAQPSQLKIHTRSHTGEKPYICEDCGASFADKGKLNGHKRTHTGERLFRCDVCGKHFATNEYLKCHKRCHLGAKPYKCDVCGKTFGLRASLAQHSNVHAETPPYFCEQCGKTFTQQGALRRHQRIHTGEKPYKCRACERTFTDMSTLRRHVLVHDRNAHWRSFLIDLTIKKDHNWSKIETLSTIRMEENSTTVWSDCQEKCYTSESTIVKKVEQISCNSNMKESEPILMIL